MVMCFHWFDDEGFSLHPGGGFEPSVYASDLAAPDHPVLPARAWGMDYKRFIEATYRSRLIGFSALGLAPGHRAITIKADGSPDIAERDRTGTDAYLDRIEAIMADVGDRTGVTLIPATSRKLAGTTSTHLLSHRDARLRRVRGRLPRRHRLHRHRHRPGLAVRAIHRAVGTLDRPERRSSPPRRGTGHP